MKTVHIVGAGLSGLAAAVALARAGARPLVWEAGPQAGGRCRSYFDPVLQTRIDNGNHLLLSGNRHALRYLDTIGAGDTLTGPAEPLFPFIDLDTGERWTLRPGMSRLPLWLLDPARRVPGTRPADYLEALKLAFASGAATVGQTLNPGSTLYHRLWEPLAVSALNTPAAEGSARLFWAIVRETLAAGGAACRPLVPREGLSESFVDPAIAYIESRGGRVTLQRRLSRLHFEQGAVRILDFGDVAEGVDETTPVVLAVTAPVAAALLPDLVTPQDHRAIANLHFQARSSRIEPGFAGIVGGTAEWVFQKNGVLSVTISAADRLPEQTPESLAETVWGDLRRIYALPADVPPCRVVREKRATFAATPAEAAKRPAAVTRWRNLVLAGDWTATGLPGTIEGSIRSGHAAAKLVLKRG